MIIGRGLRMQAKTGRKRKGCCQETCATGAREVSFHEMERDWVGNAAVTVGLWLVSSMAGIGRLTPVRDGVIGQSASSRHAETMNYHGGGVRVPCSREKQVGYLLCSDRWFPDGLFKPSPAFFSDWSLGHENNRIIRPCARFSKPRPLPVAFHRIFVVTLRVGLV